MFYIRLEIDEIFIGICSLMIPDMCSSNFDSLRGFKHMNVHGSTDSDRPV